eukprot:GEMP01033076.1.p1 GENE.GEMP01033076.1~~GEMP01033076.1.p1  ORF type:complete len:188 (+),score=46.36 GEMP01033076.1:98-661(+)
MTAESAPCCVICGASRSEEGSQEYETARKVGQLLAEKGIAVVNGGYEGTMAGSARGASEKGGTATGILVPSLFPGRKTEGNKYLTSQVICDTLIHRLDHLVTDRPCFIILPGTVGTLTELNLAWNCANLDALLPNKKAATIVAWRQPWEEYVHFTAKLLNLHQEELKYFHFVDTPEEAAAKVAEILL